MIGRGLILALVVWLPPAPANAHPVGPGSGVELELLLVAGAILFFGVKLRSSKSAKPWAPWAVMAVGVALGTLSFALPQLNPQSRPGNISIQILSPDADETVRAGRPLAVRVKVTGAAVARSASDGDKGHLHIFVDGELQQMPYSTTTEVTLSPGTHELSVEYVDARHVSYSPPIQTSIRVSASAE